MKKNKPQVFVGDPGPSKSEKYIDKETVQNLSSLDEQQLDSTLETMDDTETLSTALSVGAKAVDTLGVKHCYEHYTYKELGGRHVNGLNYATDVVYCTNCFTYYYRKGKR